MSLMELLVVIIVAFIVINPKKLPEIIQLFSKVIKSYRKISSDIMDKVNNTVATEELSLNQQRAEKADKQYEEKATEVNK